ncbi:MAG: CHASE3 domain-containing protein [Rhodospirillales bacterium]|nr:CHASE3 domain-containing protein [Acetobacter sp.]
MKSTNRYRLIMVAPILVVLINVWVAYLALSKLFDAQRWLAHTLQVLTETQAIAISMGSANNALRAYLLTGSEEFLGRYHQSIGEARANVDRVAGLTEDNASQRDRVVTLRHRLTTRISVLDSAVVLRRAHGSTPMSVASLRPALGDSPDGGVSVRYMLNQMEGEERRLLVLAA